MNKDIYELGMHRYEQLVADDKADRDSDGYISLTPSASRIDAKKSKLTTNITDLESKLRKFREEKAAVEKLQQTKEYKDSKKRLSKKKAKKQRDNLLEMVFNNADHLDDDTDDESDESEYRDLKKPGRRKKTETTLDTTYGKRFSPVVAMLHDTIVEFDQIADDISKELSNGRNQGKTMYRSSQIGNLISAKNSKLSAVKELAAVVKTLSDLEYKKEKDQKATEGSDTTKAISMLGAKYLRSGDIFSTMDSKKGKGKKDAGKKAKGDSGKSGRADSPAKDDDDEDDVGTIQKQKQRDTDQSALAAEFAKTLKSRKDEIKLTPHERYIAMEGKYDIRVVIDPTNEDDWKFVAVQPKTGKEIKGFRDDYPGLIPRRKSCKMVFDLSRLRAQDKNSGRVYKLIIKE